MSIAGTAFPGALARLPQTAKHLGLQVDDACRVVEEASGSLDRSMDQFRRTAERSLRSVDSARREMHRLACDLAGALERLAHDLECEVEDSAYSAPPPPPEGPIVPEHSMRGFFDGDEVPAPCRAEQLEAAIRATAPAAEQAERDAELDAIPDIGRARSARQAGYEGDPCPRCSAYRLVRSGGVERCEGCGHDSRQAPVITDESDEADLPAAGPSSAPGWDPDGATRRNGRHDPEARDDRPKPRQKSKPRPGKGR